MLHSSRYSHSMHQVVGKFYATLTDEDGSKCFMFINVPDSLVKEKDLCLALQYIFRKECVDEPAASTSKLIITIGDLKGNRVNYINEREPEKEKVIHCEGENVNHVEVTLRPWSNS
jgi:hypothetical protein